MDKEPLLMKDRNKFIEENKGYIYNCACKICNRKLDWLNDDELSIALMAFNNACDNYNDKKGNFYSYAKVLIKNSLIDYFRKSKNTPYLVFSEEEELINYAENKEAIMEFEKQQENSRKAEEITSFSKELLKYKLSLNDIVKASPSHIDTRNALLNIAFKCSKEQHLVEQIYKKNNLPIKEISLLTGASRKYLDKWRKYILVLIIILSSDDYLYIKSYLNMKVGENYE